MSSSQLAESALSNLRKSLTSQRSGTTGSPNKQAATSPREGRTKSRLEDRLRAATSIINEPSHSETSQIPSPPISSEDAATVFPTDNADINSVNNYLEPMSKTTAETAETSPSDSPEEMERLSEGSSTLQSLTTTKDMAMENSSHIEQAPLAFDSMESCQSTPDSADQFEQPSATGSSPKSLETEVTGEVISFVQPLSTTISQDESSPIRIEQVITEIRSSDTDCDMSRNTEHTSGSEEKTSVEELQEKLKQVEQRFTDVSASFKRLQEEKQAADLVLQQLTPLQSVHDTSALREYFWNLDSKTGIFQNEIKRLNDKLEVQEDRFEELRDTHRLESSSQSLQIEKLRKEISEAEALLKAAQKVDAQAEESANEQKTEIGNLRKELERAKLLAKEEEEKRVKAISLLKTVRQKLVKAEKEKEDATTAVALMQEKGKEETEKEQAEKSKLRSELDNANLEREKALAALKTQFEKEMVNLQVRCDQDIANYKGKYEAELDALKSAHTRKVSEQQDQIRSLQQSLGLVTKDKDTFFDDLQLRQAELESVQSHLEVLESQNTEYQYQLRELEDRYGLLKDDLAEVQRDLEVRSREPATSSSEIARILSVAESKYEAKLFDLKKNLEAVEKERNDSDADWSLKLRDKAREVEDLKRLVSMVAQTEERHEETVAGLKANITTLDSEYHLVLEQLQELRQTNVSVRESEKSWQAQEQQMNLKIAMLEQFVEESKQREGHLRAGNKTLREELRKVQSSAALLERQRNPGVGYWTSRFTENNATDSQVSVNTPSTGVTSRVSSPVSEQKTGNDEEVNLEYLRNVILQFLEHKEMRVCFNSCNNLNDNSMFILQPNLVKVLSMILHFTPQETRRLIAKV
ncbi:hypothetical protein C0993_007559 [Termitomyces sp. T159_Od127]|nr:hypothetical protein C0993_007559 [Termitomyces sp. T159_Od127]